MNLNTTPIHKHRLWIPLLLMIAGIYFGAIPYFNTDLSHIPGDYGDARFNNYILEHGHLFLTGKIKDYWNAPFMFPYKNVIGLSDNLLGSLPIYSVFRILNYDKETSFQLWIIALLTLNYLSCYLVLKKLFRNTVIAACCAYIYGFGLYNLGQIFHVQVLPRYIVPFVFYWFIKLSETKERKYFAYVLLGTVYQFYCGMYLGFFVVYFLLFLFISSIIINRKLPISFEWKNIRYYLLSIVVSIFALLPLMITYYNTSLEVGTRSFDYSFNSLPHLRSYFFTSPASVIWKFLYPYTAFTFSQWWNHCLFPGIIPIAGVTLSIILIIKSKSKNNEIKRLQLLLLTFILSFIFVIKFKGFTLYKVIYYLPGFSSMRSIDRIINIQMIFFVMLTAASLKLLLDKVRIKWLLLILLPIAVIVDNLIKPEPHKSFVKAESQEDVSYYKNIISKQYNKSYEAIAFFPINLSLSTESGKNLEAVSSTTGVMLASQELGIPCVNGYSGFNPMSFEELFMHPDSMRLKAWCSDNQISIKHIQIINDIESGGFSIDTIQIQCSDSNYVCLDKNYNNIFVANRKEPQSWETFNMITFKSGRKLIVSLDKYFLKVDPFNKRIIGYPNFLLYSDLIVTENINNSQYKHIKIYDYYVTVNPINQELTISDNINNGLSQFLIKKKEIK